MSSEFFRKALIFFFNCLQPVIPNFFLSIFYQVVLTVSQIIWCKEVTEILDANILKPEDAETVDEVESLETYESLLFGRLNNLAALIRTDLTSLHRNIITTLITIDVHARDVVTDMVSDFLLFD